MRCICIYIIYRRQTPEECENIVRAIRDRRVKRKCAPVCKIFRARVRVITNDACVGGCVRGWRISRRREFVGAEGVCRCIVTLTNLYSGGGRIFFFFFEKCSEVWKCVGVGV